MTGLNRVGLIGGISWQSTEKYYRLMNERVHARLGGQASAPVTVWSVDFAEVERLQRAGDWPALGAMFADAATKLAATGARAIGIAANTMHLVADDVSAAVDVAVVNLVDLVADVCAAGSYDRVGLIGTRYVMDSTDLFPPRFAARGIDVLVPGDADRRALHELIYAELTRGIVDPHSARLVLEVIGRLAANGAQAVILGCTEFGLLVHDGDACVPLLDTTELHAFALADFVLDGPAGAAAAGTIEPGAQHAMSAGARSGGS